MNVARNDERRPGGGGGSVRWSSSDTHDSGSGRRSSRNAGCPTLHVELHKNTARLRGARVLPLLDDAGITVRMYDRAEGCWTVPVQFADDVICTAEYRQRRFVTVAEVDR